MQRIGSGKSNLAVDSLVFALFGKTLKNTNNKYVPNRSISSKLKPYVKVYFKSDGQMYSCETYGKVSGKTMSTVGMELLRLDDNFNIIEDITQSSVAKTKQYVEENLLGCSFNVFKSSIVMTSADFMNFYEGMSKDQKRKYVETIFNLSCFGDMFTMIKTDLNDNKKETTLCKNQIISLSDKLESLNAKSADFLNDQKEKYENFKKEILDKKAVLEELIRQDKSIEIKDVSKVKDKKNELQSDLQKINTEKNSIERSIIMLESSITSNEKIINHTKKILDGLCEKCTKVVKDRYSYDTYEKENEESLTKIDEFKENLTKVKKRYETISDGIKKIDEVLDKYIINKSRHDKLKVQISYATSELKDMKEKLPTIMEEKNNPFIELIDETNKELTTLKERLEGLVKNSKHLEILKEATSEGGIKKFIMKDIVKLLNSLIQKYLNEIGCEFIVYFDETFDFKFITTTGECEFSNFSAGERQRIQIATLLAFRDLIINGKINSNIFIIDELLDANVDTTCIENVMNILKRKSVEEKQNVFIISHRSELADNMSFWNNIIKVTKENQQTRYEVI